MEYHKVERLVEWHTPRYSTANDGVHQLLEHQINNYNQSFKKMHT